MKVKVQDAEAQPLIELLLRSKRDGFHFHIYLHTNFINRF